MTDIKQKTQLVSVDRLRAQLKENDENIILLDCSWFLPTENKQGREEYIKGHIPTAQFFDLDQNSDLKSSLPHMLPDAKSFDQIARSLGISNHHQIICYDQQGLFSAPRVWWNFKAFGHHKIAVLDGGLPAWVKQGYPLEDEIRTPKTGSFKSSLRPELIADKDDVAEMIKMGNGYIIDARAKNRFFGQATEPRAGLLSGHMPRAFNLPCARLTNSQTGLMEGKETIRALFSEALLGQNSFLDKPIITSCGSGVTACILALGLDILGHQNTRIYDGSWSEWGIEANNNPIVTDQLDVTISYLAIKADDVQSRPSFSDIRFAEKVTIEQDFNPTMDRYRNYYIKVGHPYLWWERLLWNDQQWAEHIQKQDYQFWQIMVDGEPAGFAELNLLPDEKHQQNYKDPLKDETAQSADLAYFGLLDKFQGQGLGHKFLLTMLKTLAQSSSNIRWVTLNTCTLDHPGALPNYLKAGLRVANQETVQVTDPRAKDIIPFNQLSQT